MSDLFLKLWAERAHFTSPALHSPQQLLQGHLGIPDNKAKVVNAKLNVTFWSVIPKLLLTVWKQQKSTLLFI